MALGSWNISGGMVVCHPCCGSSNCNCNSYRYSNSNGAGQHRVST